MSRPSLLDLYSGAGGCGMGYHRAGFEVVGVDSRPQCNYPFTFIQADALETLQAIGGRFDVIHASPPCQRYSRTARIRQDAAGRVDLVARTREVLQATGRPWVMENVGGSPLGCALMLCGTHFGLKVIRHRYFESSHLLLSPGACKHPPRGTIGNAGVEGRAAGWCTVAGHLFSRDLASKAMGIDWMNRAELAQAIPPAYCEWVGRQLLRILEIAA